MEHPTRAVTATLQKRIKQGGLGNAPILTVVVEAPPSGVVEGEGGAGSKFGKKASVSGAIAALLKLVLSQRSGAQASVIICGAKGARVAFSCPPSGPGTQVPGTPAALSFPVDLEESLREERGVDLSSSVCVSAGLTKAILFLNRCMKSSSGSNGQGSGSGGEHGEGAAPSNKDDSRAGKKKKGSSRNRPRIVYFSWGSLPPTQHTSAMNCVFAAAKMGAVLDCVLLGGANKPSHFHLGASFLTGGYVLQAPSAAHVAPLAISLLSTPTAIRGGVGFSGILRPPTQPDPPSTGKCACHQKSVRFVFVCSVCLGVFCKRYSTCPLCGSTAPAAAKVPPKKGGKPPAKRIPAPQ